ncbi:MAG: 3-oxoacyl-[acyl-carrier-protein] reductase [Thermoplasmata archaeon]|nr:MAG: 3-oxoacyl-[acyl-carrier-protein] reductase [Thermoplasmata archaeon]
MRLKDKVALITGSGSGIGEATAMKFSEEGAKLIINDVNMESANNVAEKIKATGGEVLVLKADISKKDEVEGMIEQIIEHFGRLDILVNNAGVNRDAFVKKMTEEDWDTVITINLKGTFLCAQAAMNAMSKQKYGKIINTSSIGALGNPGQANYASSKCGVIGLTRTLALECARYNINVNCVAPGATKTPMTAQIPKEIAEAITGKIPLKRFAEPEEIANLHLFLASDEASYITGQVIFVDGGISVGI